MSITLDTGADTGSGGASVSFSVVGDEVTGGIVNVEEIQSFGKNKHGEKELHWWDKAETQPKMLKIVTVLVIAGSASASFEDGERQVKAGDIVNLWMSGQRWTAYHNAIKDKNKKAADNGWKPGVQVGDVIFQRLDELAKNENPAYSAVKVCTVAVRGPEAKDGDLADRCTAAYHAAKERPELAAGAAPAQPAVDTDSPF